MRFITKLGELHIGLSHSHVQLHSFLVPELPKLGTARKRPPEASTLGTGGHEVYHVGAKSFNKLGDLYMGPSQSLEQLRHGSGFSYTLDCDEDAS